MCVVAHPDDECFAFGGALALAAEDGVETYVICLTDGPAATNRGDAASGEALGKMRREEFSASCKALGVTRHEFWISRCAFGVRRFFAGSGAAGRKMRQFRPDVVLTFGTDGGLNTHPDHMMVSMLTTAAFTASGQTKRYPQLGAVHEPKRLFYPTQNFFIPGRRSTEADALTIG